MSYISAGRMAGPIWVCLHVLSPCQLLGFRLRDLRQANSSEPRDPTGGFVDYRTWNDPRAPRSVRNLLPLTLTPEKVADGVACCAREAHQWRPYSWVSDLRPHLEPDPLREMAGLSFHHAHRFGSGGRDFRAPRFAGTTGSWRRQGRVPQAFRENTILLTPGCNSQSPEL